MQCETYFIGVKYLPSEIWDPFHRSFVEISVADLTGINSINFLPVYVILRKSACPVQFFAGDERSVFNWGVQISFLSTVLFTIQALTLVFLCTNVPFVLEFFLLTSPLMGDP
jgi:hypothetical protein